MVTLCRATCRASPATNPVSPARAPLLMPRVGIGDFTEAEVMLTMRPNRRATMPSTVALISAIGVSMLASSARIQSSRSQSRKSPGGGPPALLTRMSGAGQAASAAARPASVVMSPATAATVAPGRVADLARGLLQRLGAAGGDGDATAFAGQRHGAGAAKALAGGADEGSAAGESGVHGSACPIVGSISRRAGCRACSSS